MEYLILHKLLPANARILRLLCKGFQMQVCNFENNGNSNSSRAEEESGVGGAIAGLRNGAVSL